MSQVIVMGQKFQKILKKLILKGKKIVNVVVKSLILIIIQVFIFIS